MKYKVLGMLMAWILIIPSSYLNKSDPLYKWNKISVYDTSSACFLAQEFLYQDGINNLLDGSNNLLPEDIYKEDAKSVSICLPAEDKLLYRQ